MIFAHDRKGSGSDSSVLVWPADRFYWALLDTAAIPRRGRSRNQQLGYLFEEVLPVPIEDVHAVYVKVSNADSRFQVVACGVELQSLRESLPNDAVALRPSSLPDCLAKVALEPGEINLLQGRLIPRPIQRLRRRGWFEASVAVVLAAVLIITGLERQRSRHQRSLEALQVQQEDISREVVGSSQGGQPPQLRLLSELRTLRKTRVADLPEAPDAMAPLASLLTAWPPADSPVHVQTQSLSVSPQSITIRCQTTDMAQAQLLIKAIQATAGWELRQPSIRSSRGGGVELELALAAVPKPQAVQP